MLKKYKCFLKISFLLIGSQLCGSAPVPGAVVMSPKTEASLWGPVIASPQVDEHDLPIGHHAIPNDTDSPKSAAYSPPAMLPMPLLKTPEKRETEFWGDHDALARQVDNYKRGVNDKLGLLKQALEKNDFDFDNTGGESIPVSPRAKIEWLTGRINQTEVVEELVAEEQSELVKAQQWPAENRKWIGPCVASVHKCHDLLNELSTNGFAQSVLGACALTGVGVLIKKKLSN